MYANHFSTLVTPQSEQADPAQAKNNAGGFTFKIDKWSMLDRWLILGSEGGSYYATEKKMTKDNAKSLLECLAEDCVRTIDRIVEISESGRAPKNSPAIFAIAIACGSDHGRTRTYALTAIPKVCRTGTHLFEFIASVKNFRGWGRGLRKAVAKWYLEKDEKTLCYQVAKYQKRFGVTHRDVFRLSHPKGIDTPLYKYIASGGIKKEGIPEWLSDFEELKTADERKTIGLIQSQGFTHEMIATEHKNSPKVWEALLEKMPLTAMVRNLGKMTEVGLINDLSAAAKKVEEKLGDRDYIRKSRVHPLSLLTAMLTYASGHGSRGSLTWNPSAKVIDALDGAFYESFENVEPTGKNLLVALDLSGSMSWDSLLGVPGLTPMVVAAAMAMASARSEENAMFVGFSGALITLNISPRQRLDDVVKEMSRHGFGRTDCALPMVYAKDAGLDVDGFQVWTDNETWCGRIHPHQALKEYRHKSGKNAKSAVIGLTATEFSIADPSDPGQMDLVGFDSSLPFILAEFFRGE